MQRLVRNIIATVSTAAMALGILAPISASAADAWSWGTQVQVSDTIQNSYHDMDISANGKVGVSVFASSGYNDMRMVITDMTTEPATVGTAAVIPFNDGYSWGNASISRDGTKVVAVMETWNGATKVIAGSIAGTTVTWGTAVLIPGGATTHYHLTPSIEIMGDGSGGTIFGTQYNSNFSGETIYHLDFTIAGNEITLGTLTTTSLTGGNQASVASVDGSTVVFVRANNGGTMSVLVGKGLPNARTWSEIGPISNPSGYYRDFVTELGTDDIAISADGASLAALTSVATEGGNTFAIATFNLTGTPSYVETKTFGPVHNTFWGQHGLAMSADGTKIVAAVNNGTSPLEPTVEVYSGTVAAGVITMNGAVTADHSLVSETMFGLYPDIDLRADGLAGVLVYSIGGREFAGGAEFTLDATTAAVTLGKTVRIDTTAALAYPEVKINPQGTRTLVHFKTDSNFVVLGGGTGPVGGDDEIEYEVDPSLVPEGGLPAGKALAYDGETEIPVTIEKNRPTNATGITVTAEDFTMNLAGYGDSEDPLGITPKQALILLSLPAPLSDGPAISRGAALNPYAQVSGTNFKANSDVKLYLLDDIFLGTVTTDGDGDFEGTVEIPAGIAAGLYTLQARGLSPEDTIRTLSLGVLIKNRADSLTCGAAAAAVNFDAYSAKLSKAAKRALRAGVLDVAASGCRKVVLRGYTSTVAGDPSLKEYRLKLSAQRTAAVAKFIRSVISAQDLNLGIKRIHLGAANPVKSNASADGRAKNRRVEIISVA